MSALVRLSKLLSERGICSRREGDRWIEKGWVLVDGKQVNELGTKVSPDCHIELKKKAKGLEKVTIILNKPVGYVSTQPEKNYRAAIELIVPENFVGKETFKTSHLRKLSCAGRLDIDSKGLLVLTQDGVIARQIIGPEANMEKEYLVRVEGRVTSKGLKLLRHGLELDDKHLKTAQIEQIDTQLLKMVLVEGKKRQIRRMCELVGLKVISLKRVRVGNVILGKLPLGHWRYLGPKEKF